MVCTRVLRTQLVEQVMGADAGIMGTASHNVLY